MTSPIELLPDSPENRELEENVHPPNWVNPEPAPCYNLVVIGGGTAGLISAAGAAGLGGKVALIERHLMGGDCLNVGCVPSKGVVSASRAVHHARNSAKFGVVDGSGLRFDFDTAMERMRRLRADISHHDSARRFRDELGIDVFIGQGSFSGSDTVEVAGKTLRFKKASVCTGACAAAPPIPGLEEAGYLTNETLFSLIELPPRMAVIGAGPIGCEMAQSFARFGSSVSLIEMGPHILGREDGDAAEILHRAFIREGIDLQLGVKIIEVETSGSDKILHLERDGKRIDVTVDAILVGVGRAPNLSGLGLEKAGIKFDKTGVAVNDYLQTSNPNVYAAGDICFPFKFTHTADALARILIANALFMGRQKVSALTIPWCTYTDPEIAHVGMYEGDAKEKGIGFTTLTVPLSDVDRAVLDGESEGFARVHLRKGTDKILGATIVARHAGEMINEFSLAITNGLGISAIGKTIHPYPTQAEVIKRLADAYNRTRLTPFVKNLLSGWLEWQRG
ncbi:Pyruvate/2-oxoglutarate dehydrogenase complex, dihydrolipoamide dehydrogenase (E3) component [Trichlorobacter thiogenes]|uniref:Pyruvate/2-oxoglutarate dehydrogenase complex, dihydrolipoamide dehydrogenase (E3) component n=1 Tax=Trichlorobacter thiogenes TaxID=115783 RepID=A0A1T4KT86_9BACT|nr:mercuric reductase [Trichlorobacter thiogenes]SJZ45548.1 Pyruvate/2-oxoglutarate dehydrogenase complex, dihydrolipoamide dehydrogenase (E3) component [Trichlorobacter thiogenes]